MKQKKRKKERKRGRIKVRKNERLNKKHGIWPL